jgi:hypothetical protein
VIELNITKPFREAVTPTKNVGWCFVVVEADLLPVQDDDLTPARCIVNDPNDRPTRSLLNGSWVGEQG